MFIVFSSISSLTYSNCTIIVEIHYTYQSPMVSTSTQIPMVIGKYLHPSVFPLTNLLTYNFLDMVVYIYGLTVDLQKYYYFSLFY